MSATALERVVEEEKKEETLLEAAEPPTARKVQLLWPPPVIRNEAQAQNPQESLVNLVACKTKYSLENAAGGDGEGTSSKMFPPGVGLFHQNGRIVFDKSFYTNLVDPSKETQDVLCEYVQSACQEQGFFVRRKQYAKPESNRSKTWRLRLRCKKTSCSFKMNFCWDVEKQYWFIPTGKDGDFVHKCGWTGPPPHAVQLTYDGDKMCTPCAATSSSASRGKVEADPATSSLTSTLSSATKRVMRLPLGSRKKKRAKSQDADLVAPVTLSPGANGEAMYGNNSNSDLIQSCPPIPGTKPVTPTPSVYGDVHHSNSFSPHYGLQGSSHPHLYQSHQNDRYSYNMRGASSHQQERQQNLGNRRLPASFSARRLRPALRNTSHNHSSVPSSSSRAAANVSPIEPPPFPKNANRKPQEPLQIISAAAPMPGNDADRDGGGEDTLSATLEEMDISDTEEGSHAELGDLKRLFTEDEEQQQHLAKADEHSQQLGIHRERRPEDAAAYSPLQQSNSSSNLFYQLHQQAVDYCSQPCMTLSSATGASPTNGYFSWNFLDYCCAAPNGGSDYYNNNSNQYNSSNSQQQQQQQLNHQDDSATASTPMGCKAD